MRRAGHVRQVLEGPGGLLGFPGGALRHAVLGGDVLVERVPLVQHSGDREFVDSEAALLADQLGAVRS